MILHFMTFDHHPPFKIAACLKRIHAEKLNHREGIARPPEDKLRPDTRGLKFLQQRVVDINATVWWVTPQAVCRPASLRKASVKSMSSVIQICCFGLTRQ